MNLILSKFNECHSDCSDPFRDSNADLKEEMQNSRKVHGQRLPEIHIKGICKLKDDLKKLLFTFELEKQQSFLDLIIPLASMSFLFINTLFPKHCFYVFESDD